MGICVNVESQNNTRLILQLAHERNAKLASYIRLTDGAIWGFLGIAAINLFGTKNFQSITNFQKTNLLLFCILLIISMFLWRYAVNKYQGEIVKGYYRIVNCEKTLNIPSHISVRKNLENSIMSNPFIHHKPQTFHDLCELLTPEEYLSKKDAILLFFGYSEKYTDKNHIQFNYFAVIIGLLAVLGFVYAFFKY